MSARGPEFGRSRTADCAYDGFRTLLRKATRCCRAKDDGGTRPMDNVSRPIDSITRTVLMIGAAVVAGGLMEGAAFGQAAPAPAAPAAAAAPAAPASLFPSAGIPDLHRQSGNRLPDRRRAPRPDRPMGGRRPPASAAAAAAYSRQSARDRAGLQRPRRQLRWPGGRRRPLPGIQRRQRRRHQAQLPAVQA